MLSFLPRIIGALLLLVLAGCSAVQTGYNNAPTLLYWWLDGYIDFNEAQARPVRDSLDSLHAWHRRQELPAYAGLLQRLQQQASGPVTPEQVCTHLAQVRVHLQRLGEQSAEGLARLAPTLQTAQLRHLDRQFEKHNRKWREEWLDGSPAELLARRLERTVDRYEDFYGSLSEAQKALLRERITASSFDARLACAASRTRCACCRNTGRASARRTSRPKCWPWCNAAWRRPSPPRGSSSNACCRRAARPSPRCTTAPARHNGAGWSSGCGVTRPTCRP